MTQPRNTQILLADILNATDACVKMVQDLSFKQFEGDLRSTSATLYQLTLIGEAASRLPQDFKSKHSEIPWRQMSDMRNVLIHHYEGVNLMLVWRTLHKDLPKIKKNVQSILDAFNANL